MRAAKYLVAVLFGAVALSAQSEPRLEVTSPLEQQYVSGALKIEARLVPLAAEQEIARASFFADGTNVCTISKRPWSCPWNAGPVVRSRQIRVVMELKNGRRLAKTIYTKGIDLGDSTGVSAVQVTATVKDGSGRFVPGLRRTDFKVFEAEAPQVVTGFAAEQAEVTVALAIDTSGSMARALPSASPAPEARQATR